jgi:hypothetical protein
MNGRAGKKFTGFSIFLNVFLIFLNIFEYLFEKSRRFFGFFGFFWIFLDFF